jgi:hypothetical protein
MDKNVYTEYSETIKVAGEETSVIVQVPQDQNLPVHIILQTGGRLLRYNLAEITGINDVIRNALADAGWEQETVPPKS